MNPDFNYNHDETKLNLALGVDENFVSEISSKIATLCSTLVTEKKGLNLTLIIEELVASFPDEYIVTLAAFYIKDRLDQFEKSKSS